MVIRPSVANGPLKDGMSVSQNATDPNTGQTVACTMVWTAKSPCTRTSSPEGPRWDCYGTLAPSGNPATLGDGQKVGDWTGQDGKTPVAGPNTVDNPPTPTTTPPKVCGGGSCYDASSDLYCASVGGNQICVSGSQARTTGSCGTGGGGALCAGSPAPLPPVSAVPDPATQIQSSDHTVQADPQTGAQSDTTTNVYAPPGQTTDSGKKDGDSSTGDKPKTDDKGGSASGGADCGAPPICSGDAPTCMVVSQSWLSRCKPDWYDKDGDGEPDWVGKELDASAISDPTDIDPKTAVSQGASDPGVIDQSGWAGNTCPALPNLELFGKSITYGDQPMFCDWLAKLRAIFLLVAAFISARILASGGKS